MSEESLRQKAIAGVRWTSMGAVVCTLLQLLRLAVLARLLDRNSFGLMAMITVVIGLGQLFQDVGVSNAIIQRSGGNREQLSSLYWLNVVAGLLIFGLVLLFAPWVAVFYGEPRIHGLMFWAAFIFLIGPFGQQFQILLQKELQFKRLAIVEMAGIALGSVVAVWAAWMQQGVFALVLGQIIAAISSSLLAAMLCWKVWHPLWHFRWGDVRGYVSFGLYQMGERCLNYLAWNTDKLLIGKVLGADDLGLYSVAYQIMIRPLLVINPAVTRVAFPVFSTIQQDDERLKRGYLQVIQLLAFVSIPVYLGMLVTADSLVSFLLGPRWAGVTTVLQILCVLGIFYSLSNPIGSLLLSKGKANVGFWFNVVGLLVYVLGVFAGASHGVAGVAWGILIASASVLFPIEFWIRWKLVRLRPEEFLSRLAPFLILGLGMVATVSLCNLAIQTSAPGLRLVMLALLGASFYLFAVFLAKKPFLMGVISMARSGI